MFLKEVFYAQQGCIYVIINVVKQYNCEILLQFEITAVYLNIFSNVIYSCDGKVEFSAVITPVT